MVTGLVVFLGSVSRHVILKFSEPGAVLTFTGSRDTMRGSYEAFSADEKLKFVYIR